MFLPLFVFIPVHKPFLSPSLTTQHHGYFLLATYPGGDGVVEGGLGGDMLTTGTAGWIGLIKKEKKPAYLVFIAF